MSMSIKIDMTQAKRLENKLDRLARKAIPFAVASTMTGAAFATQRAGRDIVAEKMIQRNSYTRKSIQVDKARPGRPAVVGSVADYMAVQEFGGTKADPVIATSYSAGLAEGTKPRTRLPRKPNKMASIQLKRGGSASAMTRRRRAMVKVKEAAENRDKFVYLDLGKRKGIFKVLGGKRKPRIRMVHDLSRSSVTIPKTPWLQPATKVGQAEIPRLYVESLMFQMKRRGIL